jgi:cytochrome c oxidase cbb3-type subunit 4
MDINDLRSIAAVLVVIASIGIVWWAYSPRNKASFEEAGRVPLDDDDSSDIVVHPTGASHADQQDK